MAANVGFLSGVISLFRRPIQVSITSPQGAPKTRHIKPVRGLNVAGLSLKFDADPQGCLRKVNDLLSQEIGLRPFNLSRPLAANGQPGAMLEFDFFMKTSVPLIVVGDLHGNEQNLNELLKVYGRMLDKGEIQLVFLGDYIHPESGDLKDMTSSLRVLKALIALKNAYPDRVQCLLGNHDLIYSSAEVRNEIIKQEEQSPNQDTLDLVAGLSNNSPIDFRGVDANMLICKGNSPAMSLQVIEFLRYLIKQMKAENYSEQQIKETLALYQGFFDGCPLSAIWEGEDGAGLLAHSATIRKGVTRKQLTDARLDSKLVEQLLWNRYEHDDPDRAYTEFDSVATAKNLWLVGKNKNRPVCLVGGHTPHGDGKTSIYEMFNSGILPPLYRIIRNLIVHGNVGDFYVLEVGTDGLVDTGNDVHAIYAAYLNAGGI